MLEMSYNCIYDRIVIISIILHYNLGATEYGMIIVDSH